MVVPGLPSGPPQRDDSDDVNASWSVGPGVTDSEIPTQAQTSLPVMLLRSLSRSDSASLKSEPLAGSESESAAAGREAPGHRGPHRKGKFKWAAGFSTT
jgi:hypothetical protein